MGIIKKISRAFIGLVVGIGFITWLGLQIQPKSFPPLAGNAPHSETMALPVGLPAPVGRFYQTVYGEEVPIIDSAILQGRGTVKPFLNIPIPARFVFVHKAGKDYRHYFEATLFGMPLIHINEGYIDGQSFFESPMGSYYNDANANQGANLAVWAEALWFPSLWVTDPRIRWESVDDQSALLYVPFGEGEENFLVRFNPITGLIDTLEAMRYRDPGVGRQKILWICRSEAGQPLVGTKLSSAGSVMWLDQGKPWAYFNLEEILYNTDVNAYMLQKGY